MLERCLSYFHQERERLERALEMAKRQKVCDPGQLEGLRRLIRITEDQIVRWSRDLEADEETRQAA